MVIIGEAIYVWAQGIYGKSLNFPAFLLWSKKCIKKIDFSVFSFGSTTYLEYVNDNIGIYTFHKKRMHTVRNQTSILSIKFWYLICNKWHFKWTHKGNQFKGKGEAEWKLRKEIKEDDRNSVIIEYG